ncbi:MAG: hypothetical protein HY273_06315 [Gammaproteobacteria bacterium]|nr:hypothetical protein [Gammaproteobacteria bacterium]
MHEIPPASGLEPAQPQPAGRVLSRSLGLGIKFVLLVSTILFLTLGAMTVYRVNAQDEKLQAHLKEEGTILGRFVALISPEAILAFDFES